MEDGTVEDNINKIVKVIVVGDMGTGKTSYIRQYVQGLFSEFYRPTIGVDFANKEIIWNEKITIGLQLWDIAGQERYGNMTRVYYQEAVAAVIVFDVLRLPSLDTVLQWKKDIDSKIFTADDNPIPCLLVGNKIDLCRDGVWAKTAEEMEQFTKENGFIGFFEISAKEGENVSASIDFLVQYIMNNHIEPKIVEEGVDLKSPGEKKSGGCCH